MNTKQFIVVRLHAMSNSTRQDLINKLKTYWEAMKGEDFVETQVTRLENASDKDLERYCSLVEVFEKSNGYIPLVENPNFSKMDKYQGAIGFFLDKSGDIAFLIDPWFY